MAISDFTYIHSAEFHYCHRCGWYLVGNRLVETMVCTACLYFLGDKDARKRFDSITEAIAFAQKRHEKLIRAREFLSETRAKYFPDSEIWKQIRYEEHEKLKKLVIPFG